jgi:hypothetical protein
MLPELPEIMVIDTHGGFLPDNVPCNRRALVRVGHAPTATAIRT